MVVRPRRVRSAIERRLLEKIGVRRATRRSFSSSSRLGGGGGGGGASQDTIRTSTTAHENHHECYKEWLAARSARRHLIRRRSARELRARASARGVLFFGSFIDCSLLGWCLSRVSCVSLISSSLWFEQFGARNISLSLRERERERERLNWKGWKTILLLAMPESSSRLAPSNQAMPMACSTILRGLAFDHHRGLLLVVDTQIHTFHGSVRYQASLHPCILSTSSIAYVRCVFLTGVRGYCCTPRCVRASKHRGVGSTITHKSLLLATTAPRAPNHSRLERTKALPSNYCER